MRLERETVPIAIGRTRDFQLGIRQLADYLPMVIGRATPAYIESESLSLKLMLCR